MLEHWENAIVTNIFVAMHVKPGAGKSVHHNRQSHGFVLNDSTADKIIHFSDGTVLNVGPNAFHYLPKGSDYRVETLQSGGCWAINFDLLSEISEAPFHLQFRNNDAILKLFKDATTQWRMGMDLSNLFLRKTVYEIIMQIKKEEGRRYMPGGKEVLILPAVETINRDFTKNDLTVQTLAAQCGISEAYFRRIFVEKFSVSPKQYIINLRTGYAKRLLESGQFSVQEIARMCGYTEPCHFSREFHKNCGQSPGEYAKGAVSYT